MIAPPKRICEYGEKYTPLPTSQDDHAYTRNLTDKEKKLQEMFLKKKKKGKA